MKTIKPFLVISYSMPDRASGTPVVIRKFLENFGSDEVVLIGRPVGKTGRILNYSAHYPTYLIPTPPVGTRGERLWRFLSVLGGTVVGLYAIKTHRPRSILAFYRDESSLLTGYLLHKITGLPLYSYFCDLYLENFPKGVYGKLAAWLQPHIFSHSTKVIALTEAMKDYFKSKYQIDAVVLPHCNNTIVTRNSFESSLEDPVKIGYLGAINIDRITSLKILCESISDNDKYKLYYFSPTPREYLEQHGLNISNSEIAFIPSDEKLLSELSKCDVLFLPVMNSNETKEREAQVMTGFPTKVIEYLICQKPILAHSTPDNFTAQFFNTYHCGLVVNGGSRELLAALEYLRNNPTLRVDLVEHAYHTVSTYFYGSLIAENFRRVINTSGEL